MIYGKIVGLSLCEANSILFGNLTVRTIQKEASADSWNLGKIERVVSWRTDKWLQLKVSSRQRAVFAARVRGLRDKLWACNLRAIHIRPARATELFKVVVENLTVVEPSMAAANLPG